MLAPSTNHSFPAISMPYVEEIARSAAHRSQRRVLMLDLFNQNRWLFHQDFLARVAAQVEKPQPATPEPQPGCNPMAFIRPVAFHGWRKLAWYVIGLLDNVSHVWRIAA